jgi:hypothetical protein
LHEPGCARPNPRNTRRISVRRPCRGPNEAEGRIILQPPKVGLTRQNPVAQPSGHEDNNSHVEASRSRSRSRSRSAYEILDRTIRRDLHPAGGLRHIACQEVLAPIYRELLSAGGVEISLRSAGDYVRLDTDCSFSDLVSACQQKTEIALGVRLAQDAGEVLLNPSRRATWRFGEHDKVIVLAQQVYQ